MGLGPPRLAYLDGIIMHFFKIRTFAMALPKTNIDGEHRPGPKKRVVSQTSIFKCHVRLREDTWISYNPFHTPNFADSKHLFFQHSQLYKSKSAILCMLFLSKHLFTHPTGYTPFFLLIVTHIGPMQLWSWNRCRNQYLKLLFNAANDLQTLSISP